MNEYIKIDVNIDSHPKYLRLARIIGHDPLGYLTHLLCSLGKHYPTGVMPIEYIEDACRWEGQPGRLVAALYAARIVDEDGRYHGWEERSGEALQEIHEKHEKRRADDRDRKAKKAAAERAERERLAELERLAQLEHLDGEAVPHDSADFRNVPHGSADFRNTETETNSRIPPGSNSLPTGQRADAGAGARVEGEEIEAEVDRLLAGIRQHINPDGGLDRERPAARHILTELRPPGRTPAAFCARVVEVMPAIAASGEFGRGPLPEGRKSKFHVTDAKSLATVLTDAFAKWPSRITSAKPDAPRDRARWVDDRTGELERATRAPGQKFLRPEQRAAVDEQVQREAEDLFGPAARAGPPAPALTDRNPNTETRAP